LSVGQPIDEEVVVHHLLEAYGDGQTPYAALKKLEQCHQQGNEKVFEFKIHPEELLGLWRMSQVNLQRQQNS